MSDGSWLPQTWGQAIPQVIWGALTLGFVLEFCASVLDGNYGRSLLALIGVAGSLAMLLHRERLFSINPNWVFPAFALLLIAVMLSPFVEQRRWPYEWFFDPIPSSIRADFEFAEVPDLGEKIGQIRRSDGAYQGEHENGLTIWMKPLRTLYVLPANGRDVMVIPDATWCDDPRLCDPAALKEVFPNVPKGLLPPIGGVAAHWEQLKAIGWIKWECGSRPIFPNPARQSYETYYQEFRNGVVMGIFPPTHEALDGNVFRVFKDGTWSVRGSLTRPPICVPQR